MKHSCWDKTSSLRKPNQAMKKNQNPRHQQEMKSPPAKMTSSLKTEEKYALNQSKGQLWKRKAFKHFASTLLDMDGVTVRGGGDVPQLSGKIFGPWLIKMGDRSG